MVRTNEPWDVFSMYCPFISHTHVSGVALPADCEERGCKHSNGKILCDIKLCPRVLRSVSMQKSATQVDVNFEVTPEIMSWAKKKGFRNPVLLVEEFVDYHSMRGTKFLNWQAAFRTWIRNDAKFNPVNANNNGQRVIPL